MTTARSPSAVSLGIWKNLRESARALRVRSTAGAESWFARHYFQPEAEQDEGFRHEVERLSVAGLRTIGMMTVLLAVMTPLVYWLLPTARHTALSHTAIGTVVLGLCTYSASYSNRLRPWARFLGASAVLLLTAGLIVTGFFEENLAESMSASMGLRISVVMLITLVSLPLHPIHTTRLAFAQLVVFGGVSLLAIWSGAFEPALTASVVQSLVSMLFIMVLGIALTATVYRRTFDNYQAQTEQLRLAEQMRDTRSRALVAENAAILGRLAAALSHELNSPIAVVKSGVETLDKLWEQTATAPQEKQARLRVVRDDLSTSIREATGRMEQMVKRMQRFSNLDGAEVLPVDVNAVLSDVTGLLSPEQRRRSRIELDLQVVPEAIGRPEQINRAFESLIHGVLQQAEREGTLRVRTRARGEAVAITLEYESFGSAGEAFDGNLALTFEVSGKRVAASNWDLVTARQIIEEHAGEVQMQQESEGYLRITVVLPAGSETTYAGQEAQPGEEQKEAKQQQCWGSFKLRTPSPPRDTSHLPA